jgi:hypothetical protein
MFRGMPKRACPAMFIVAGRTDPLPPLSKLLQGVKEDDIVTKHLVSWCDIPLTMSASFLQIVMVFPLKRQILSFSSSATYVVYQWYFCDSLVILSMYSFWSACPSTVQFCTALAFTILPTFFLLLSPSPDQSNWRGHCQLKQGFVESLQSHFFLTMSHCPVDYLFASRHKGPRFKSQEGTDVKQPGFSC